MGGVLYSSFFILISQHIPQIPDALLRVPFASECPLCRNAIKGGSAFCLVQVIIQPAGMSALARTITIIGALPPRARVEHLVRISIADVLVQHILRKRAVYQEELRIVMIPPQSGRALGIKRRVRDDQLLALVSPAVMPNHRTAVSIEPAPRSIAPPARAKEVYTRTTQVKVGMIIHASTLGRPKGKRVVSVRPYITIDNNRPRAPP